LDRLDADLQKFTHARVVEAILQLHHARRQHIEGRPLLVLEQKPAQRHQLVQVIGLRFQDSVEAIVPLACHLQDRPIRVEQRAEHRLHGL
jgi:hypothetical protein